jgi:MFS family permease
MLHSLAGSVFSLAVFRFMLGTGEGFNKPGANKTATEWLLADERGLGITIFDSRSSVSAIIAPPLVAIITYEVGWRYSFVVIRLVGFLWLVPWLYFYHPLRTHPRLSEEERKDIEERQAPAEPARCPHACGGERTRGHGHFLAVLLLARCYGKSPHSISG